MLAPTKLFPVLCLLVGWSNLLLAQHLLIARPQRSLYGSAPLGWNTIGGGGINPIGLGHMSKDELLTLLDAWREVEGDTHKPAEEEPEPEPEQPSAPPPPPPPPPSPPAPPAQPQRPASSHPLTVRLPAFVPIQLSAMYTAPQAGVGGGTGGGFAELSGISAPGASTAPEAAHRIFRFMPLPLGAVPPAAHAHPFVVRNTLDSVDAGTSPTANRVKPKVKTAGSNSGPTTTTFSVPASPPIRPRFVMAPPPAPFLGRLPAPLELVPSSQLLSNWH
ncbi:WAS/WASL-interacting protein family member 3 [Scaptodrosophila lebanonensis]|uniref:WAS/WASL-interacting protein family member 3 n=1 Tax=Drosophila lebanonensis TaxID=7225 RepID=A0A6J2TQG9_DROLE|nr:WAS/WASL-interacting protein family member 3 [Scaptodrosophila lebanonensis]